MLTEVGRYTAHDTNELLGGTIRVLLHKPSFANVSREETYLFFEITYVLRHWLVLAFNDAPLCAVHNHRVGADWKLLLSAWAYDGAWWVDVILKIDVTALELYETRNIASDNRIATVLGLNLCLHFHETREGISNSRQSV